MSRYCGYCGSNELHMPRLAPGHLRKECAVCGSTGPFTPAPPPQPVDVSAAPHIHRRTDAQLEAGVQQFTRDSDRA